MDKPKKSYKSYLIRSVLAIIIILIFLKWINIFDSVRYIKEISFSFFFLAAFTILIINITKMFRFYYLAKDLNIDLSLKDAIIAHFIAPIIGRITPAKLGEGLKIFILKKDRKKLGFAFILEKLTDTFTLLIISVFAVYTFGSFYNAYITLVVLFILIIVGLFNIEKILNFMFRKPLLHDKWFKSLLQEISPAQIIVFIAFSTIIRFLILSVPYIISTAFGLNISIWLIFQMYAVSMLIGWLSGLPGGIGTREFSFSFLLITYASVTKDLAGIVALLVIITDLIIESLLALVGWVWLRGKK